MNQAVRDLSSFICQIFFLLPSSCRAKVKLTDYNSPKYIESTEPDFTINRFIKLIQQTSHLTQKKWFRVNQLS